MIVWGQKVFQNQILPRTKIFQTNYFFGFNYFKNPKVSL